MADKVNRLMSQSAPFPHELESLVARVRYRPGWRCWLEERLRDQDHGRGEAGGLTLVILTQGYDSYHPENGQNYRVQHFFIVPAATYNAAAWQRWLFECFVKVETHEAMEFFATGPVCDCGRAKSHLPGCASEVSVSRPYAPLHGPGEDPYVVHEYATDEQRRTRFTGDVVDG